MIPLRFMPVKYVRFERGPLTANGILDGELIREIHGSMFGQHEPTVAEHKLADVKLLYPCQPPKILAVGLNYRSHLRDRKPPEHPEMFYKPVSALQHPEGEIAIPPSANNVHYEGELVVVIGRQVRNASPDEARDAIFGVTCGNDVSERDWQNGAHKDLQWWRAKGSDTFAPLGPAIVSGIDYGKLHLETRLNGRVVQKQSTSDLIFDCPAIVSFVSQFVSLMPGDLIYTGTPGATSKMSPGDVVEVEIEGIGVLRNRVVAGNR
ncbi:MAG TPA: fumarylacetoacetate hydrolase family protein [Bryobacteraceae bacterium]|nr:fumarylacetoacetate hydrolase family protein [Bryobacteraceae bacterium]